MQQKEGGGAEAEQNRQVIRSDIVGQRHVWVNERPSARGVKCNVGKDVLIPPLQTPELNVCVLPRGKPANRFRFLSLGLSKGFAVARSCGRPIAGMGELQDAAKSKRDLPSTESHRKSLLTRQPLPTTSTHSQSPPPPNPYLLRPFSAQEPVEMTTMAMAESFDAQMMDFSGEDIPMQTSSSASWVHPEATMDDDSNYNLGDVEIDMENYHPETFEYEMTDDSSTDQPIEVHDVEVVDVSQVHTPALIDTVVEDAIAASPAAPEQDLTDTHDHSPLGAPPTLIIQAPSPTSQPTQDEEPEITVTESLGRTEWEQGHSEPLTAPPSPLLPDHHQPQHSAEPASPGGTTESTPTWDVIAPVEQQELLRQLTPTLLEQLQPQSTGEEPADPADRWVEEENPAPSRASSGDPHEVLDGIFIDPPPPVLLSLGNSEEEYCLFNRPTRKSPTTDNEEATDDSLFLHDLPTLYYEPLAKVFEALRLDPRLNQIFDLSRGELVVDAYDLVDLVISEVSYLVTLNEPYDQPFTRIIYTRTRFPSTISIFCTITQIWLARYAYALAATPNVLSLDIVN